MDRKSVENMKLDRRLIGRRGWISDSDLKRELEKLADVSAKGTRGDPDETSEPTAAGADAGASGSDSPLG